MKKTEDRISYSYKDVGIRLKNLRLQEGWSRSVVAGKVGIHEKYYGDIERGSCGMSVETLLSLAGLYSVSLDYLIYGNGENIDADNREKRIRELFIRKIEKMNPDQQQRCLSILLLFMEWTNEEAGQRKQRTGSGQ